jgi:hypothetical protein
MHSSNTCDMYEGFCIGCKNTAESFYFLFTVSLSPPHSALHAPHRIALPPLLPATSDTTYSYVTCSKVNAKSAERVLTSRSDGAVRKVI